MGAQMMKKKILKGLAVFVVLLFLAGAAAFIVFTKYPNLFFKLMAKEIKEGQTVEVSFEYDSSLDYEDEAPGVIIDRIPLYRFTPSESAGYNISITDIKCDEAVNIEMNVMDQNLEDYAAGENYDTEADALTDSFTAEATLQESQQCFILIESSPGDESVKKYSGSFKLSVTKKPEEELPPEIFAGESVKLQVGLETQACAMFIPEETSYYRFVTTIDPGSKSTGYSMISSVTGKNKQTIGVTDGICKLEKEKEYYIWVSVYETNKKKSDVELSCSAMNTAVTWEKGKLHVTGDTVIEYRPAEAGNVAVYSVSEGDPKALIYEKDGFPLRTDDDTETSLSGNSDDFAVAFSADKGIVYRICVFGGPEEYDIIITDYIGDGSSLTADDIAPLPEETEGEEAEGAEGEETEEAGAEEPDNEQKPDE